MEKYLTVSALTKYIKYKFDKDPHLQSVLLKGEISNFKKHSSGHLYFAIKDQNSVINAMMFKGQASKLDFVPKEGDQVLIEARVSVYEPRGNYQIYVNRMELDGIGNLYQRFEKLKLQLSKEGYFDESHKKPLPKYPMHIAILTAQTGAAIRDIHNTLNSRFPLAKQHKISTLVQGKNAKEDIIEKLKYADSLDVDLIILGRGGGSIEDLWNFNEEDVVKAIYHCQTPVISAVGHETDTTLSDYVADVRAATPTQAAMLATPDQQDILSTLHQTNRYLTRHISQKLQYVRQQLSHLQNHYKFKQPTILYEQQVQRRDELERSLHQLMQNKIEKNQQQLALIKQQIGYKHFLEQIQHQQRELVQKRESLHGLMQLFMKNAKQILHHYITSLNHLSPSQTMLRGYSIIHKDKHVTTSSKDLNVGDEIDISMKDGIVEATIKNIRGRSDD